MQHRAATPATPELWDRRAARQTAVATGIGAVLLLWAYLGATGRASFDEQIGSLNLAVIGSVVAAAAQGSWLLRGRRALSLRRRLVAHHGVASLPAVQTPERACAPRSVHNSLVVVAGGSRRHRTSCLLVQGKELLPVSPAGTHRDCEVCRA